MNKIDKTVPPVKKRQGWLVLCLRWCLGGFVGFVIGIFLFIGSVSGFIPYQCNLIFGGQVNFVFLLIVFFEYYLGEHLSIAITKDDSFFYSLFLYSALWGLIGALLASGRKKQIITGVILLVLYIIGGFWAILRFVMQ